jgi:hypothetical protein
MNEKQPGRYEAAARLIVAGHGNVHVINAQLAKQGYSPLTWVAAG